MRVEKVTRSLAGLTLELSQPTGHPDTVCVIEVEIPNVRLAELQQFLLEPMTT